MSKFGNVIKVSALAAAVIFAANASASVFKVPLSYSIELVDGISDSDHYDYSRFNREITLTPGRHQIVVRYEENFGGSQESRLVQASNPIVIEIPNIGANEAYSFKYKIPSDLDEAKKFAREQKIELIYKDGGSLPQDKASWYVLTSESGIAVLRDYRQDLMSIGRLYAPSYVDGANRGIGMTSYGAPTIQATSQAGNLLSGNVAPHGMTMDVPTSTYPQESNMATSSTRGGQAYGPSYRDLVRLYESADDKTKLQFMKYVMSH